MASTNRLYSTKRDLIVVALAEKLKEIDGTGDYLSNVFDNVEPKLMFWDEVNDFPAIHLNAGTESRVYHGGGVKDRFLNLTVRCYVNEDYAHIALAKLLEDVETLLEDSSGLQYTDRDSNTQAIHNISITSIETDEGVLEPLGVAEMLIEVRY